MNFPTVPELCVVVRGGIEFWLSAERANKLKTLLASPNLPRFIEIDGNQVNSFEIVGVFSPQAIEEKRRRANGQWTCRVGNWHDKGHECRCLSEAEKAEKKKRDMEFYEKNGYFPL